MPEFCKECGSIKIAGVCTNRRLHDPDFRSFAWVIDGTEYRFRFAVTREEAERAVQEKSDIVLKRAVVSKNRYVKPWTKWE